MYVVHLGYSLIDIQYKYTFFVYCLYVFRIFVASVVVASWFRHEVRFEHAIQKGRHWNACQKNCKNLKPRAPSQAFWTARLMVLGGGNPSYSKFGAFSGAETRAIRGFGVSNAKTVKGSGFRPPKNTRNSKNSGFRPSKQQAEGPQNAKPKPRETKNTSN